MKKIIHIIVSLGSGGAERTLLNLATNDSQNIHKIVTLKSDNFYKKKITDSKIEVIDLNFDKNFKIFEFYKLFKIIKSNKPNILQTWLYHSDLIGGLAGKLAGVKNIIWNIRGTLNPKIKLNKYIYLKIISFLSHYIPKKIISCSSVAIDQHINFGYKKDIFTYIPNGIAFIEKKNNKLFIDDFYKRFKIKDKIVLCTIARYHEQKNHEFLLKGFQELEKKFRNKLVLLLIGKNIQNLLNHKGLINDENKNNIILLDEVVNIKDFFELIDLHILTSSYGEGFPNIILETLSCRVPNISSNVGDAKLIINNDKFVFDKNNLDEFLLKCEKMIQHILNKDQLFYDKIKLRSSEVIHKYSIKKMTNKYREIWCLK